MKIAFVTDSTADIPSELAAQHGIEVIPNLLTIRGQSYQDGVEISREQFYTLLPVLDPAPTTASPSAGVFQVCYEKLFQAGAQHIFSIHPARTLSGVFNTASLAAQEFTNRISVVDSGQLSLGIGYQVLLGAERAEAGGTIEQVAQVIRSVAERVRTTALLTSLEYMRRSGRVSWTRAKLGSLLHIHPLVELRHGEVLRIGQSHTRRQGIQRLLETVASWGKLDRLAVLHTNAEASARELKEQVRHYIDHEPLLVHVTTTIGTHVGPDGLGFAAVPGA